MPNFSQIRFQLVKISIFIVIREVTIMKYESLTTHNIYILIAESPMHYSSSTATLHITLYNSFRPINISHHFPATVLFRCRCYGTGGD